MSPPRFLRSRDRQARSPAVVALHQPITWSGSTPGTEDEYGSCWGFEHTFSSPLCGYIQMDNGQHRMYRWYQWNPVRFQNSLTVRIQNQRMEGDQVPSRDDYTSVVFWYQEDAHPAPALPAFAERTAPTAAAEYTKAQ